MTKIAVYPGSFDPITNGHLDIIERTTKIFDNVIVAVFHNPNKKPLFSMEERVEIITEAVADFENVEVDSFEGLLTDYIKQQKAQVIVRGLRAVSDFETEFQMASMNKKLEPEVETIFMMTNNKYAYLSSSIIKEVSNFGGCIEDLVPEHVISRLKKKIGGNQG
ncbi:MULTISPECIES: pantetheine-phosphate adenylyltransferase [unclassified Candidatus Frackibacter]|uniref:pantetheine-phosphate adenylyltransferase n=1 Tax=unclassified Candidatus Frackibacter TaxID=2648818 RepID=UPI000794BFAB|nr:MULTISPECIES: pantetheine-phosphate adenylyltransferase [unclassified Candidatus Frackibacter]KXS39612.1 MAG: pantetheine-phosphate adenylyltransferase [Candidatus Frackibacter sp. T328-2]SDC56751.1 Phosphopantetheine adenylyltransferase [Candidatus Frackibacter sp. WG11]SEM71010.1 Phosphopantetheine adenylyltransferase [Candidatus Frackibacter sp. WG12]SFL83343.1 Phosphopantetheine adenylyltransferase [Candidatus Frackibacter sp. WG13]